MARCFVVFCFCWLAAGALPSSGYAQAGANGPDYGRLLADPNFFPLGIWLQQPKRAEAYRELGINLYVGLWKGPTASQLAALKRAAMPVVAEQNDVGLTDPNADVIIAWMHQDEPDNAQKRQDGLGYGPPVTPAEIVERYQAMRARDPSRPVLLGLGQGVAWDMWKGRGDRINHPEDYPQYIEGSDIVAFDIYPVTHPSPLVAGRLDYVAKGVARLKQWAGPERRVWNTIGASRVANPDVMPSADQLRSQVWLSIIHGSRGIIYFVHQIKPTFIEAAIFDNADLSRAMTRINRRITALASVINGPETNDLMTIDPIAAMTRRDDCAIYLFTASTSARPTTAEFKLAGPAPGGAVEVLGEDRSIPLENNRFSDRFDAYGVHLYKLSPPGGCPAFPLEN